MTLIVIGLVLFVVLFLFTYLTRNYINPYKLIFVFGKKGSGKSTLLTKLSNKYLKCGWTVYSTEAPKEQGAKEQNESARYTSFFEHIYYLDPRKLYHYNFPPRTCIFIDEASLIWDNRDFKTMDKKIIEWFRYQRHHKCRVYLFSQSFDVDLKIRSLVDEFYIVRKYLRVFVIGSRIIRKPVVVHPSPESPARIDDDMIVDPPIMAFFGGKLFAYIPYWAHFFDSHKPPVEVGTSS